MSSRGFVRGEAGVKRSRRTPGPAAHASAALAALAVGLSGCAATSPTRTIATGEPAARVGMPRLELLGEARLPTGTVFPADPPVDIGGLSGCASDPETQLVYAVSDDRQRPGVVVFRPTMPPDGFAMTPEAFVPLSGRPADPAAPVPLDLEGLARLPGGILAVASEGDGDVLPRLPPGLWLFEPGGRLLGGIRVPGGFLPGATGAPSRGVRPNQAFESLTPMPDGRLLTATEGPLLQDDDEPTFNRGARARLLEITPADGTWRPAREFVYPLEAVPRPPAFGPSRGTTGLAELLALDDARLLALERSFVRETTGERRAANVVRLFLVDLRGADDVSSVMSLRGLAPRPVGKQLLLDLGSLTPRLSPRLAALENFEGLCEGPRLPDGGRTLLLVSDNNFSASQVTAFLLFRLNAGA